MQDTMTGDTDETAPTDATSAVALVCQDTERIGPMTRLFRRMVGRVEIVGEVPDAHSDYSMVVVHYDKLSPRDQYRLMERFADPSGPPLVLLSEDLNHGDLASLFGAGVLTNLVRFRESGPDLSDLLVTLHKLTQDEIFGLDKYFGWGVQFGRIVVQSSEERAASLDQIDAYATERAVPRRLRNMIRNVLDEFLSNALYNAPTNPDGSPRFGGRSRNEPVELGPDEELTVNYCCDGRRFGLSIRDPFGSLSPDVVLANLARAFRGGEDQMRSTGGAGLGFLQMFDSVSHLVVNIQPGHCTEIIGLIDVSGGYRAFVGAGTSFNIFVKGRRP
ncbi:MAG: hypothetical protein KTR31_18770 [Myxococcales bacterium]|nr:hypothetical protein [Myxococcales bacterium]